jgi:glycosyltransferase involved in cell wall biosynthesis
VKLLVAIPALDEEASIGSTIEAVLTAREGILADGVVSEVCVTVVSDGSTDRTVEIARRYEPAIELIVFPRNRGYGAAIKEAWRRSDAELLGFLDADGTCDPRVFTALCRAVAERDADVVLGDRMGATSRMPALRRLGNRLFAGLLSVLAGAPVRDSASGMRVVRRGAAGQLMPLPDGLHFTPAMSARALLAGDLQLVEVPMPYAERAGESKLSVVRDGFRFLRAILDATLLYRPARLLEPLAVATAAAAVLLMATPLLAYLRERAVADWMIYRFLVSQLLGTLAFLLLGANYLSGRIVGLWRGKPARPSPLARGFAWLLRGAPGWTLVAALLVAAFALVAHGLWELFATGHVVLHWSRFVAMAFLAQIAALTLLFKGIGYGLDLVAREQRPGGRW